MLERDLIPVPLQHQGRSGDGGELGQVDLRSGVMNTPAPDWSDERAVVDHLVLQAGHSPGRARLTRSPLGLTPKPKSPAPPTSSAR